MADYASLLRDHVTLTCRSVDRIFLQNYVPKVPSGGWVCQFLRWQRHYEIPSSAAFGKIGDAYVAEIHRWAKVERGAGSPRVRMAVLAAIVGFTHLHAGFDNPPWSD